MKPHLYINHKGYPVTRHSYSGSESFDYCARKYYLERVQGWAQKEQRSSTFFGKALEAAITFWHQHREDTVGAITEFQRLWGESKDKDYTYAKTDKDWGTLLLDGCELIQLYAILYPTFPYIVNNPLDFQVENNFEVFPDTALAGIEFTAYIDLIAQLKGTKRPLVIDMKTSGKDIPELTVLDPQLRSYSWVKNWPDVAFLWFRKMGRAISRGDVVTILDSGLSIPAGQTAFVLAKDDFGLWLTQNEKLFEEMEAQFIGESKVVKAARASFIQAHGISVSERAITKQRVQFKAVTITEESREDIGKSIKRDIVNIARATETEFFPMQSGVRFPNEKCPNCAMRGICSNNPDLRDALVTRKQLTELDFGNEAE
jgi:PD-(D/E)XK nuclease superfamily